MFSSLLGLFGCGKSVPKPPEWPRSRKLAFLDNAYGVAADSGSVYAGNFDYISRRGTMVRVPAAGGTAEIFVDGTGQVRDIRIADGFLYWNGDGALRRVPLAGGAPETVARGAVPAHEFVIAHGRVWFSAGIPLSGPHYVYSAPQSGGEAVKHFESQKSLSHPHPEGDFIYWITPDGLARLKKGATAPELVHPATGGGITTGLTRDEQAFYFFQQGAPRSKYTIVRWPIAGGPATSIAAPAAQSTHEILSDGDQLYYAASPETFGPYELRRVPKAGGDSVALDRGYLSGQLASDAENIYVVTIKEIVAVPKV